MEQIYTAGLSLQRAHNFAEAFWNMRVKPSIVSELNQNV
jgi:hypothetical protein